MEKNKLFINNVFGDCCLITPPERPRKVYQVEDFLPADKYDSTPSAEELNDLTKEEISLFQIVSKKIETGITVGLVGLAVLALYGFATKKEVKPVLPPTLQETIAQLPAGELSSAVEYAFISRLHSRYDTGQYLQLRQQGNCPDVEFLREYLKPTGKDSWDGIYEQRAQLRNEFEFNPKFKCYKTRR